MNSVAVPGTEAHPHARVSLTAALRSGPSHAYLFHGPAGVGKRAAARAFAAELLAEGAADPDNVRHRVEAGTHPDLTWVRPTGAHVMRRADINEAVVGAASRTPFESARRVFVLERADEMNDEAANSLLKTLEEPASFVHLILVTDSLGQMIDTVVSRCQPVRFDPLPAAALAAELEGSGVEPALARSASRLALGNGDRARLLASDEGQALLGDVDTYVAAALRPAEAPREPYGPLLARAEAARGAAEERVAAARDARLEGEPKGRERTALERQFEEAAKREARRAHTEILELGLTLGSLAFRDLVCLAEGAPDAALDPDRASRLAGPDGPGASARSLRRAAEGCERTRLALEVNVTEALALEALGYRLARLVGSGS